MTKITLPAIFLLFTMSVSNASVISLYDWAFNVNGTTLQAANNDQLPTYFNQNDFDWNQGLGTLSVTFGSAGNYSISSFFDHEIDEDINGYFNEYGQVTGNASVGQTWEIDEPGWTYGNIYSNLGAGNLDNSNGVNELSPDDVSMGMGWNFSLQDGESATVKFNLAAMSNSSALNSFYLAQIDPNSNDGICFSSSLHITPTPSQVPEPKTGFLMIIGLIGIGLVSKSKARGKKKTNI